MDLYEQAEQYGKAMGLDLLTLFEQAADIYFDNKIYEKAYR